MQLKFADAARKILRISVPLTGATGKIRVKSRNIFNEYGVPVATRSKPFSQSCYIEWQIGYDVPIADTEKLNLTTLGDRKFTGANGKIKALYELSEYIYYFYHSGIIPEEKLKQVDSFLCNLTEADFIDNPINFSIDRTQPVEKQVCGIDFYYTQVKYPILIHRFGQYEILTEIKITEKQRAVGVQPMLYFCFPITELQTPGGRPPLLGRTAAVKETTDFIIDTQNIDIFIAMLKIFGMLSCAHNHDIRAIINVILAH